MIDKDKVITNVFNKLKSMELNTYIDLRTYKRNRSLIIIKISENEIRFIQNGYEKNDYIVRTEKLDQELKKILKKEFPRSNKVRLYSMGEYNEGDESAFNRKKL